MKTRFDATAGMSRRWWLPMYGGIAILSALMAGLNAFLAERVLGFVWPVLIFGSLGAYGVWLARLFRPKTLPLDLSDEGLSVDEGRGGSFPLAGARLGLWRTPGLGVSSGTALHLTNGETSFHIGGRDHRAGPALQLEAEPVDYPDAVLSATAFDALLAALPASVFRARWDAPTTPPPLRVALMPNPSGMRNGFRVMLPWFGTIVLVGAVGFGLDAAGLGQSAMDNGFTQGLMGVIVVGGLALTIYMSMRQRAGLVLELGEREIRMRDPAKGRVVAEAPIGLVTVTRGVYRYDVKGTSYAQVVLSLRFSAAYEVSFMLYDMRYRWRDGAESVKAPRWIVGAPDWTALCERFGLQEKMIVEELG